MSFSELSARILSSISLSARILSFGKDFDCGQGSVLSAGNFCLVGKDVRALSKDFESTIRTRALFLERICALSMQGLYCSLSGKDLCSEHARTLLFSELSARILSSISLSSMILIFGKDFDCGQGSVLSARIFCLVGKDVRVL